MNMGNLMSKVAEILGVEIGEEFKINDCAWVYKLETNMLYGREDVNGSEYVPSMMLTSLLNGEHYIVKKPWKPQEDEEFYYIGVDGRIYRDTIQYQQTYYQVMYKCGNMFKTEEEITPEMISKYVEFLNNYERVFGGDI